MTLLIIIYMKTQDKLFNGGNSQTVAIVFDLLGVILDEEKIASKRLTSFLQGRTTLTSDEIKQRYADGLKVGKMSHEEFWSFVGSNWQEIEASFLNDLKFISDAQSAIQAANKIGKVYLLSEIPRRWAENLLKRLGVMESFTAIFVSDDFGLKKEDIELFQKVSSIINAETVIYIDDKEKNLIIPSEMGWQTIWFTSSSSETLYGKKCASMSQLIKMLEQYNVK